VQLHFWVEFQSHSSYNANCLESPVAGLWQRIRILSANSAFYNTTTPTRLRRHTQHHGLLRVPWLLRQVALGAVHPLIPCCCRCVCSFGMQGRVSHRLEEGEAAAWCCGTHYALWKHHGKRLGTRIACYEACRVSERAPVHAALCMGCHGVAGITPAVCCFDASALTHFPSISSPFPCTALLVAGLIKTVPE